MKVKLLSEKKANAVYDILVKVGGAREKERPDFVYHHCKDEYGCMEWRFTGHLGFGGKYRSPRNGVSFYSEDTTPERTALKKVLEELLKETDGL